MENRKFTEALALYRTDDERLGAIVENAVIMSMELDRGTKKLYLTLTFDEIADVEDLYEISEGIKTIYSLNTVKLTPKYDSSLYSARALYALCDYMAAELPSAAPFLKGCKIEALDNTVKITLADCSAYLLKSLDFSALFAREVAAQYGVGVRQVLIEDDKHCNHEEELNDYAEKIIEEQKAILEENPPPPPKETTSSVESPRFKIPAKRPPRPTNVDQSDILMGNAFGEEPIKMELINTDCGRIAVCGEVFALETRTTYSGREIIIAADITDKTGSVRVKKILSVAKAEELLGKLQVGSYISVRGDIEHDKYYNDCVLKPVDIVLAKRQFRSDRAQEKRVELHLHTNMSQMDGISSASALISRAKEWGHSAIAITDHGVTQGFPEAAYAGKDIKVIYGMEGYFVNDLADIEAVRGEADSLLSGEFVCFDIETTGTIPTNDGITEIAANLVVNGEIKDTFQTYTNPGRPISAFISNLTGITNAMVKNAPSQLEGVKAFKEFCKDRILVAHNAKFDTGFISYICEINGISWNMTSIDTLEMSRILLPDLKKHKLNFVAKALNIPEFKHHSAAEDTKALSQIFIKLSTDIAKRRGVTRVSQLNAELSDMRRENQHRGGPAAALPVRHIILLAKDKQGIKNLNKLVSLSHIEHLNRRKQPIIPRHELDKCREGLIVGSACEAGELYRSITERKSWNQLRKIAHYYDYLEIQPLGNNAFMLQNTDPSGEDGQKYTIEDLRSFNKTIVKLGEELGIPVVATGDVHFLDPDDAKYRAIIMASEGFKDADDQAPLFLKTTEEMLEEFSYLGAEKAREVVITNPKAIADQCAAQRPFPDGLYPPKLPGSAEELRKLTWKRAHSMYGDPLPDTVRAAIESEIEPIIGHGFDVMYMLSQKLIARSLENGYLVGSRGSVGSSVVAFFAGITEINALPPHYRCPSCKYSEFHTDADSGPDLPDAVCPRCETTLDKDGFDIPFATFLGIDGDKDPDIDLNFSSVYQSKAHRHMAELFGEDKVFRAGTISTIAEATAYGYVKKYHEVRNKTVNRAEESRLALGCTGVKKTTGQHPGGIMVVPQDKDIHDFCPIQRPGTGDGDIITTHIDYHSLDSNLLKFDLLGKDDPTILRYLEEQTGVPLEDIPLDDKLMLSLFSSNEALGIFDDRIVGSNGALGIPEFGTRFVRDMLNDTLPETIADLVRISGLSHGENVWVGNAQTLIKEKNLQLRDCICCRDDIMNYLIKKGMDSKLAFKIMEVVRKKPKEPGAKKLLPEWEKEMLSLGVPQWYIDSCNMITYLFPKAHAAAYVVMALRIAWYKVHRPLAYYGSFFGIKAKGFDAGVMLSGKDAILRRIDEISGLGNKATQTEKELLRTLEISYEFLLRGFVFLPIDIMESDAELFSIYPEKNALRLSFKALGGLGSVASAEILAERARKPFVSVEDLATRCRKLTTTNIDELREHGALTDLPESLQTSLFELD